MSFGQGQASLESRSFVEYLIIFQDVHYNPLQNLEILKIVQKIHKNRAYVNCFRKELLG